MTGKEDYSAIRNAFGTVDVQPENYEIAKDDPKTVDIAGQGLDENMELVDVEEIVENELEDQNEVHVYNEDDENGEAQPEEEDEPIIRINKQEFTRTQLLETVAEYYNLDLEQLPEDTVTKLVESYIDANHLKSGKGSLDKKHQEIAEKKRELNAKEEEISAKELRVTKRESELNSQNKILEEQKLRIERQLSRLEEDRREMEALLKLDPDEQDDEASAIQLRLEQKYAKKNQERFAEAYDETKNQLEALKGQISANDVELNNIYMDTLYNQLLDNFPELETSKHFINILEEIESTGTVKDYDEAKLSQFIGEVVTEYVKSPTKLSIADFYALKFQHRHPAGYVKKDAKPKQKTADLSNLTAKEMAERIYKKQLHTPSVAPSFTPTTTKKKEKPEEVGDYSFQRKAWGISS